MARRALGGCLILSAALLLGFFVFAAHVTRDQRPSAVSADAIVALTGGAHRIRAASRLLETGQARRLLVSGVNRRVTESEIRVLTGLGRTRFGCCVDIGYTALNTRGNADETRAWMIEQGFRSLIVVTASYHMPRSLAELSRKLPGVRLHAHPVRPASMLSRRPWWQNAELARLLAIEYVKFLPAATLAVASAPFLEPLALDQTPIDAPPTPPQRRPQDPNHVSASASPGL